MAVGVVMVMVEEDTLLVVMEVEVDEGDDLSVGVVRVA